MDHAFYQKLAQDSINKIIPDDETCLRILDDESIELLPLLQAAYEVRKHFCGKEVNIHILNNVKNGACPEDCNYCAQGTSSEAEIVQYITKSDDEVMDEAALAYEAGAHRYCMVYSGTGLPEERAKKIGNLVQKIKAAFPLEVCVSAGIMDEKSTRILKDAGLDRMNHNLNTTNDRYHEIATTHTYQDRINTINNAHKVGLAVCSGIIAGMGESSEERVELAKELRKVNAASIPVNLLIPIEGNKLTEVTGITPQKALRIFCMFRFVNPDSELRAAAGREEHLRSLEAMALYPCNSLFLEGYLNTRGSSALRTLQMIKDAGFDVKSDKELEDLIEREKANRSNIPNLNTCSTNADLELSSQQNGKMKGEKDLRPAKTTV